VKGIARSESAIPSGGFRTFAATAKTLVDETNPDIDTTYDSNCTASHLGII